MVKIKNWANLQHFKDRSPPWIKLYREILYQRDIMTISDRNFKVLICLWLIASEDKQQSGTLPAISDIAFKLRLPEHEINKSLQELKDFLIFDDINMISERYQVDAPETETETETETEKKVFVAASKKKKKLSLDELSIDHIADWLAEKRLHRKYLDIDEQELLEMFKDYCRSKSPKYSDYVAALRNAFKWENAPRRGVKASGKQDYSDMLLDVYEKVSKDFDERDDYAKN